MEFFQKQKRFNSFPPFLCNTQLFLKLRQPNSAIFKVEKMGFEPMTTFESCFGLANQHFRPLSHFSNVSLFKL